MKATIIFISAFVLFTTTAFSQNVELSKLTQNGTLYYLNGKAYTGKAYVKHENGSIGMIGEIKNGMKEGTWVYYYSDGKKKRESPYIHNKKEGLTYYWYQNGQLAKEIMYRDDKNIDQKIWDVNGNRKKIEFESFR